MKTILLKKEWIHQGNLILVNRNYEIKQNIKKDYLTSFNSSYPNILLEYECNLQLQKVLKEIHAKDQIVPVSGYRAFEEQQEIFQTSLKENGETFTKQYVAYPNCSEHQTGLAIDLALNQENIDFIRPSFPFKGICQEFRNKMAHYGFIQRYTQEKEPITQISSEEWHFRYVGYPHSEIMKQNHQCLEEYIDYLTSFQYGKSGLAFQNYEISYIKMDKDVIEIQIPDQETILLSGNNVNGIIITKRRLSYCEKANHTR